MSSATLGKILCCLCGRSIDYNSAAMCIECLRTQNDITEDIEKQIELSQCRKCEKWHHRLDQWVEHDLESTGLMTLCLKKISALSKKEIKVLDTAWVWTEPHSRRLKLSIDIERAILDGKISLRQRFIVEYVMNMRFCTDCARQETDHTWGGLVQIRQTAGQKRSLYYLEGLLTKSGLSDLLLDVETTKDGLDLYCQTKGHAEKISAFISSNIPTRAKASKKIVSHNVRANTARQEWTICLDVASLAKDDLIISGKDISGSPDLILVSKISSSIHLVNPFTLAQYELNSLKYFTCSPSPLLTAKQLEKFVVMDIELVNKSHQMAKTENNWALAEVEVAKESDFGANDRTYNVITHLGNILQIGDLCLGYDLSISTSNEELFDTLPFACPDVVLVRKTYPEKLANTPKKAKKPKGRRGRKQKPIKERELQKNTEEESHEFVEEKDELEPFEEDDQSVHEGDERGFAQDSTWLGIDDIEYELYRQQVHDEQELRAEENTRLDLSTMKQHDEKDET